MLHRNVMRALAGAAAILLAPHVFAQAFPSRPVRLVVPYAPGGGVDTVARAMAQELGAGLGGSVVVENRPGANSIIGSDLVAKSPADGHVLLITVGTHYAMPFLAKNVSYDPVADFTPVTVVGRAPQVLAVPSSLPVNNVAEFIEHARRQAGKMSFATAGSGTSQHLGGELMNVMAKLDMAHVPYKGGGPALNDLVGQQVPSAILILSNVLPHARSGKVRLLGVIESSRAKAAPEVPTVGETLNGFAVPDTWIGVLGPARMPAAVLSRLDGAITAAANLPAVRTRLDAAGFELGIVNAQDFAKLALDATRAYRRITADAKIAPE